MVFFLSFPTRFFTISLFLFFKFLFLSQSSRRCLPLLCSQQDPLFIVPIMTRFYCFNPQLPLFGLGVLADHHCSVCVSPSHHQTRKSILFACLPWHPFLLRSGFFLSPYPSWHAPSGSNLTYLFWVVSHLSRTPPQKSLSQNLKNRFFPSLHHQTMPSESLIPRPYHALY